MFADKARMIGCIIAAGALTGALVADNCVIQVGDRDGFGLGEGIGMVNFAGDPVNVDGVGLLGVGDYLPDWNEDGAVAAYSGDDFDVRTPEEISGFLVGTWGMTDIASYGSHFTDLAVSRSYDETFGVPNDFPDPPSTDRNDASFVLDFGAEEAGLHQCGPLQFKIVFADVGGGGMADLILTMEHRTVITEVEPLDKPSEDGVIRSMIVELDFFDVFTLEGDFFHGYVEVEMCTDMPDPDGDAYFAIDYIQLWNPTATCAGDVTGDGVVDVDDLLDVLGAWGDFCPDPCEPGCAADIDGNTTVDVNDLLAVLALYGACP